MGTSRKEARALAKTTLQALGVFEAVLSGAPNLFAGRSPVCVVTSRSLVMGPLTRGVMEVTSGITVSIYVRRDAGESDAEAAEDQLDDLALSVIAALHATDVLYVSESSAGPENGNLRDVDRNGVIYRIERIPLTVLDETER